MCFVTSIFLTAFPWDLSKVYEWAYPLGRSPRGRFSERRRLEFLREKKRKRERDEFLTSQLFFGRNRENDSDSGFDIQEAYSGLWRASLRPRPRPLPPTSRSHRPCRASPSRWALFGRRIRPRRPRPRCESSRTGRAARSGENRFGRECRWYSSLQRAERWKRGGVRFPGLKCTENSKDSLMDSDVSLDGDILMSRFLCAQQAMYLILSRSAWS